MAALSRAHFLPWIAGVSAAVSIWLVLQTFVWLEHARRHQIERAVIQAKAATVRSRLESELNSTLSLSLGLSTFVLTRPDFSQSDLAQVANSLLRMKPAIRSVAVAPDNVIRYIHPLVGNEKALGLRYLDTPGQRDAVLRLMREKRPVTAGPVRLAQGGIGIVNRIPIVFTRADGGTEYWGLASVAIDPAPVYRYAGLVNPDPKGMRYALRGRDGLGNRGEVFLGDAALFDDPEAVLMEVVIPGGTWQLAARGTLPAAPHAWWNHGVRVVLALLMGALTGYAVSAHQRIRSMALFDSLTGLANRHQFNLRARDLFSLARRTGCRLALLNIDIDDFKHINDTYGHAAGDAVLVHVARTLRACCRESDVLARLGGDEFVVLLRDTPDSPSLNQLFERLHEAIEVKSPGIPEPIRLHVSIGVASCSESTPTLDALMREADAAMYRNKEKRHP